MDIRRATSADARAIATVHVRSWQSAYRGLLPQDVLDGLDPRRRAEEWTSVLDATAWPTTGTLVLTDEAAPGADETTAGAVVPAVEPAVEPDVVPAVVGFASLSPTRDDDDDKRSVGELQTLYLDPLAWRRGGGSRLLRAVQDQLAEAGFHTAVAWVLDNNDRALSFYERHHWRPDGAVKFHDWGTFMATDVRYRIALL